MSTTIAPAASIPAQQDDIITFSVAVLRVPGRKAAAMSAKFRAWNLDEIDITWDTQKKGAFASEFTNLKIEGFASQMMGVIAYFEREGIKANIMVKGRATSASHSA